MSFFDLENELPGWLDGVLSSRTAKFKEITNQTDINNLDSTSLNAYHMVCAGKGSMVAVGQGHQIQGHQIWKFEEPVSNMRTYGKYLEEDTSINPHLQFWVGIVVQNKTITPYLWFGGAPPPAVQARLQSLLDEIKDKGTGDYWYRKKPGNSGQTSVTLSECCGCCCLPLSKNGLGKLKQTVTNDISDLLDAVEQAIKNI